MIKDEFVLVFIMYFPKTTNQVLLKTVKSAAPSRRLGNRGKNWRNIDYPGSDRWQHFEVLAVAWGKLWFAFVTAWSTLTQNRVETPTGCQGEFEIKH